MSSRSAKRASRNKQGPYHHDNLAAKLLQVAQDALEKDGLSALSLREVARRAGVSHNAPYRHFRDREELLAALAAQGFATLSTRMEAAAETSQHPMERRLAFGRAYVLFALDHPGMFRLMFSGLFSGSKRPELTQNSRNAFRLVAETATSDHDPPASSLRAWALVHGVAHLLLDHQMAVPPDLTSEAFIDKILSSARET